MKNKSYIDLHTHSKYSDGTDEPIEIIKKAMESGLKAISITDHDSVSGILKVIDSKDDFNIDLIPGVEISVECEIGHTHILGYFIDPKDKVLNERLDFLKKARNERTPKIIKKLNEIGIKISREDIFIDANSEIESRVHIAKSLARLGFAKDIKEAFDLYLGDKRFAYVKKQKFSKKDGIKLILDAGGIPVLAHPFSMKLSVEDTLREIREMMNKGLMGIEVFYPDMEKSLFETYLKFAKENKLLITGGSDYHGNNRSNTLGIAYNNEKIDAKILYD